MTKDSLIDWAASWVPLESPTGEPGQRERFIASLKAEVDALIAEEREACALRCKEAADAALNAIKTQNPGHEGKAYLVAFSGGAIMCMDAIRARGAK